MGESSFYLLGIHVFKIEIGNWDKAKEALNIVKEYLAEESIPIIAMKLSWGTGNYKEVLLNTTNFEVGFNTISSESESEF